MTVRKAVYRFLRVLLTGCALSAILLFIVDAKEQVLIVAVPFGVMSIPLFVEVLNAVKKTTTPKAQLKLVGVLVAGCVFLATVTASVGTLVLVPEMRWESWLAWAGFTGAGIAATLMILRSVKSTRERV